MIEILDMGKYSFYVWTSVGIFIVALMADFIGIQSKTRQVKQMIKSKQLKARAANQKQQES